MENKQAGQEEMKMLPFIIAVDFDGTLVSEAFPEIGKKNSSMFRYIKRCQEVGCKIVLWTCRDDDTDRKLRTAAVDFCRENGLEFDAVNKNIPEVIEMFKNDTRKVYANVYIDDKSSHPDLDSLIGLVRANQRMTRWR